MLRTFDRQFYSHPLARIAGIDEAGRGPLAGPVVAAACVIGVDILIEGINDSKKLSPQKRAALYQRLTSSADIFYGVGIVDAEEIDRVNIYEATKIAMYEALKNLNIPVDLLLVDGLFLPYPPVVSRKIIRGDAQSYCIAAASIIAKQVRDEIMEQYHDQWPLYGFNQHKGYPTKAHKKALEKYGPCPIHRRTYAPVQACCSATVIS